MLKPTRPITPTHAAHAAACLHVWHLECFGDPSLKLPPTSLMLELRENGLRHEKRLVATLKGVETPDWDGKDYAQGCAATLDLMKKGAEWIYQGVLASSGIRGKPDLLQKTETGYIPVDIKSHKDVRPKDKVQLAVYAKMLGDLLGAEPVLGRIWDSKDAFLDVNLGKLRTKRDVLLAKMVAVTKKAEPTEPIRCGECKDCPWLGVCKSSWTPGSSLSLVRGASQERIRKLHAAEIRSIQALLKLAPADVALKLKMKPTDAGNLLLHARAAAEGRALPRKKATFPSGIPVYFYDIETYENLTYLHGAIRLEDGKREEKHFMADSLDEAGRAWADFMKWISRDKEAVVYTWTNYENAFVEDCQKRFGGDEAAFARLKGNLVDMKVWVEQHWALPVYDYSIKVVAPIFGFSWQAEDAGGLNSISWYEKWLKTGDPALREKLVQYNLDDVRAMERIYERLRPGP